MVTKVENSSDLRRLHLFVEMGSDELDKLARVCFIKSYKEGQTLFIEGMAGEIMYVVISGEVEIFKHKDGGEVPLIRLGMGEFVGEGSLVLDGKRSTSCRVSQDAELLVITKKAFQDLSESNPSITTKLLAQFLKTSIIRLRSANKLLG